MGGKRRWISIDGLKEICWANFDRTSGMLRYKNYWEKPFIFRCSDFQTGKRKIVGCKLCLCERVGIYDKDGSLSAPEFRRR